MYGILFLKKMNVKPNDILNFVAEHGPAIIDIIDIDHLIKLTSELKDFNIEGLKIILKNKKYDKKEALERFLYGYNSPKHTEVVRILGASENKFDLTHICLGFIPHYYLNLIKSHKLKLVYHPPYTKPEVIDFLIEQGATEGRKYMLEHSLTTKHIDYFRKFDKSNPIIHFAFNKREDLIKHCIKLGYKLPDREYVIDYGTRMSTYAKTMIKIGYDAKKFKLDNTMMRYPDAIDLIKMGCTVTHENIYYLIRISHPKTIDIVELAIQHGYNPNDEWNKKSMYEYVLNLLNKTTSQSDSDYYKKIIAAFDTCRPTIKSACS